MGTADAANDNEQKNGHFIIPANQRVKNGGMDFYEKILGSPKYVVSVTYRMCYPSSPIYFFFLLCCC